MIGRSLTRCQTAGVMLVVRAISCMSITRCKRPFQITCLVTIHGAMRT